MKVEVELDGEVYEIARRRGGKLATLDTGLAGFWPDVAVLLPA